MVTKRWNCFRDISTRTNASLSVGLKCGKNIERKIVDGCIRRTSGSEFIMGLFCFAAREIHNFENNFRFIKSKSPDDGKWGRHLQVNRLQIKLSFNSSESSFFYMITRSLFETEHWHQQCHQLVQLPSATKTKSLRNRNRKKELSNFASAFLVCTQT